MSAFTDHYCPGCGRLRVECGCYPGGDFGRVPGPAPADAVPAVLSQGYALNPVKVEGEVQLYDIYVRGEWIGSRRTIDQCHEALRDKGVVP